MINAEGGHVKFRGTLTELKADFCSITGAFYAILCGRLGEDEANETIAKCGRMALMSEDELHEELSKELTRIKEGK